MVKHCKLALCNMQMRYFEDIFASSFIHSNLIESLLKLNIDPFASLTLFLPEVFLILKLHNCLQNPEQNGLCS